MTEKQYRLNKSRTKLLKNNRPLFDWVNYSDEIVDLLNELNDENKQLKQQISYLIRELKTEMETSISKNERNRLDFAITVLESLKR